MKIPAILLFIIISVTNTFAQQQPASERETYIQVITERANKITATLGINDPKKAEKTNEIIRDQYSNLNDIYAARDTKYKEIKVANKDNKILQDTLIAQENRKVEAALAKLHQKYLKNLAKQLNATQIERNDIVETRNSHHFILSHTKLNVMVILMGGLYLLYM